MNEGPTGPADEPFVVRDTARSEVLHRHARLSKKGRPVFCTPSRAERAGMVVPRQGSGTNGKVIYPTREAAEAAARELERLGARTLRAYLCGRSGRDRSGGGHYHLASDAGVVQHRVLPAVPRQRPAPEGPSAVAGSVPTPAELFARIPQQRRPLAG